MSRLGIRHLALAAIASILVACASGGASNGSDNPAPRRDRTVITAADIRELNVSNLLEVVQRVHPEWLTPRNAPSVAGTKASRAGTATEQAVQVYIDLQHAGNADVLGQLSINSASSLKYYSASEAQARFGNGNLYGAIQVISVSKP